MTRKLVLVSLTIMLLTGAALAVPVPFAFSSPGMFANPGWGTTPITFDGGTAPANYTGNFDVVTGDLPNVYRAPTGDSTAYITTPKDGSANNTGAYSIAIAGTGTNYFGLYWGSFDTYNNLTFHYTDGTNSYTGNYSGNDAAITAGLPGADQSSSAFINFVAPVGFHFTGIDFSSTQYAFETDNHTYGTTPEPASMILFGTGLLGAGVVRRLRKKA